MNARDVRENVRDIVLFAVWTPLYLVALWIPSELVPRCRTRRKAP